VTTATIDMAASTLSIRLQIVEMFMVGSSFCRLSSSAALKQPTI
jgi:hypothetical protein